MIEIGTGLLHQPSRTLEKARQILDETDPIVPRRHIPVHRPRWLLFQRTGRVAVIDGQRQLTQDRQICPRQLQRIDRHQPQQRAARGSSPGRLDELDGRFRKTGLFAQRRPTQPSLQPPVLEQLAELEQRLSRQPSVSTTGQRNCRPRGLCSCMVPKTRAGCGARRGSPTRAGMNCVCTTPGKIGSIHRGVSVMRKPKEPSPTLRERSYAMQRLCSAQGIYVGI